MTKATGKRKEDPIQSGGRRRRGGARGGLRGRGLVGREGDGWGGGGVWRG